MSLAHQLRTSESSNGKNSLADSSQRKLDNPTRRPGRGRSAGSVAGFLCLLALPMLACGWAGATGSPQDIATDNAYWNCPTASPIPTRCEQEDPPTVGPGTPTLEPIENCSEPLPTVTPYGRWLMPDNRGTSNTFYKGQDVYIGSLKINLSSYASAPIPDSQSAAHIFTFAVENDGDEDLDIQWPLQMIVREITLGDGTSQTGDWYETERSEAVASLPNWDPEMGSLRTGQRRTIQVAVDGPVGEARAIGFLPDPTYGRNPRDGGGVSENIVWFLPRDDVYCDRGNGDGPANRGEGGAVEGRPLATPAPAPYGYFQGWPIALDHQSAIVTQPFGCTAFPEILGYDCPNNAPYFHAGVDIAAKKRGVNGDLLLSTVDGIVTFVGPSSGKDCSFMVGNGRDTRGSEAPHQNLGWVIILSVLDPATSRPGPYTIKYGHTVPGGEAVQVGDRVHPGDIVGRMGSTGCSTNTHLHFQVQNRTGAFIDPFNFIGGPRR